jgi:hypothetical protein
MELNTGLPLALGEEDFDSDDGPAFGSFIRHLRGHLPDLDPEAIRRIVVQYEMQVRTQHAYRLSSLDAPVLMFEPKSRYSGLVAAQVRPYVKELTSHTIELSEPSARIRWLSDRFGALVAHYRSMRDERFVEILAREISRCVRLR